MFAMTRAESEAVQVDYSSADGRLLMTVHQKAAEL